MEQKNRDEYRERILCRFEAIVAGFTETSDGGSALRSLGEMTTAVDNRLVAIYKEKFPKECMNCGRIFESREHYLQETKAFGKQNIVVDDMGVQEYRNCVCGSTMMIWTGERRDMSLSGHLRRELFDACVVKLRIKINMQSDDEAKEFVRKIFRLILAEELDAAAD